MEVAPSSPSSSSSDRDPEDELRDRFGLGFNSGGELRRYDKDTKEITEDGFEFDVHDGDKKLNQARYAEGGVFVASLVLRGKKETAFPVGF